MENTTTPMPPSPSGARGAFLTVICILTFIGSGFGLLGAVTSYSNADANAALTSETVSNLQTKVDEDGSPDFIKDIMGSFANSLTPANIKKSALMTLISTLLTLIGAIMMFLQKKEGFYMYVAGIIIYVSIPIMVIGGLLGIASAVFYGVIGLAFIIMYAVNLKHMTK